MSGCTSFLGVAFVALMCTQLFSRIDTIPAFFYTLSYLPVRWRLPQSRAMHAPDVRILPIHPEKDNAHAPYQKQYAGRTAQAD